MERTEQRRRLDHAPEHELLALRVGRKIAREMARIADKVYSAMEQFERAVVEQETGRAPANPAEELVKMFTVETAGTTVGKIAEWNAVEAEDIVRLNAVRWPGLNLSSRFHQDSAIMVPVPCAPLGRLPQRRCGCTGPEINAFVGHLKGVRSKAVTLETAAIHDCLAALASVGIVEEVRKSADKDALTAWTLPAPRFRVDDRTCVWRVAKTGGTFAGAEPGAEGAISMRLHRERALDQARAADDDTDGIGTLDERVALQARFVERDRRTESHDTGEASVRQAVATSAPLFAEVRAWTGLDDEPSPAPAASSAAAAAAAEEPRRRSNGYAGGSGKSNLWGRRGDAPGAEKGWNRKVGIGPEFQVDVASLPACALQARRPAAAAAGAAPPPSPDAASDWARYGLSASAGMRAAAPSLKAASKMSMVSRRRSFSGVASPPPNSASNMSMVSRRESLTSECSSSSASSSMDRRALTAGSAGGAA